MPMKLTESDIARQVRHFLEWRNWRRLRMQVASVSRPTGGGFRVGEPGMADTLYLRYLDVPGAVLALWIETKALGKKPSPQQEEWITSERARGALVEVVDNIEAFMPRYRQLFGGP